MTTKPGRQPAPTIDTLRARIAELQRERGLLHKQRRNRAETAAFIDDQIGEWQERAQRDLALEMRRVASGQISELFAVPTASYTDPTTSLGPILVGMLGPVAVRKSLQPAIDALPDGVMSTPERSARLAEIAAELDDLETQEERLIEADGAIARRADARPEIVLAVV